MFKDRKFDGSWLGVILCFVALYFKFGGDFYDYISNPESRVVMRDLFFWGVYFGGGSILYVLGSFAPAEIVEERRANRSGFGWGSLFSILWGSMPLMTHYYEERDTGVRSAGDVSTNLFLALIKIFAPVIMFVLIILAYIILLPFLGALKFVYNWLFLGLLASLLARRQVGKDPYLAMHNYRCDSMYRKAIAIAEGLLEGNPSDFAAKVELLCSQGYLATEGFEAIDFEGEEVDVDEINSSVPEDAIRIYTELVFLNVPADLQPLKDECVITLGEHLLWCISGEKGSYLQYLRDDVFNLCKTIFDKINSVHTSDPDLQEMQNEWRDIFRSVE